MKIKEKLDENKESDRNFMIYHSFNLLYRNNRINPLIDVNISSCYVKLCLGGLRAPIIMVNDHYKINKISLVYLKEWNEVLTQIKVNLDNLISTEIDSKEYRWMKIIVMYNEGLLNLCLGEYGKAYEIFKHIISLNKYYTDAYLRLASLLMILNNKKKSIDYWK